MNAEHIDEFNDFLDEIYEPFKISDGWEIMPHEIIREFDPIAYDEFFANWLSENYGLD